MRAEEAAEPWPQPESHSELLQRLVSTDTDGSSSIHPPDGMVQLVLEPGDFVVMTEMASHCIIPWQPTDRPRRALTLRFYSGVASHCHCSQLFIQVQQCCSESRRDGVPTADWCALWLGTALKMRGAGGKNKMDADLVRSSFTRWLHLPPPPFQQQHADAQLGFCLQAEWRDHVGPLTRAMLDGLAFGPAAGVARL